MSFERTLYFSVHAKNTGDLTFFSVAVFQTKYIVFEGKSALVLPRNGSYSVNEIVSIIKKQRGVTASISPPYVAFCLTLGQYLFNVDFPIDITKLTESVIQVLSGRALYYDLVVKWEKATEWTQDFRAQIVCIEEYVCDAAMYYVFVNNFGRWKTCYQPATDNCHTFEVGKFDTVEQLKDAGFFHEFIAFVHAVQHNEKFLKFNEKFKEYRANRQMGHMYVFIGARELNGLAEHYKRINPKEETILETADDIQETADIQEE
jgi:hypothetical protein